MRLQADFDNFRKRTSTEKDTLRSQVKGDTVAELLPLVRPLPQPALACIVAPAPAAGEYSKVPGCKRHTGRCWPATASTAAGLCGAVGPPAGGLPAPTRPTRLAHHARPAGGQL